MLRSFRYRLYPTSAQEHRLVTWLGATLWLYNAALQQRRDAWRTQRKHVGLYAQQSEIPELREVWPELNEISVQVLRGALRRLDRAFIAFFSRCQNGEKPGYPRFKSISRWNSLQINDLLNRQVIVSGGRRVHIPLLGNIKLKLHRPLEGKPKALQIKRDGAGRWWVMIACENVQSKPLPKTGKTVGIDLGLTHFVATSDGATYENERHLAEARLLLERAHRRVSRRKKNSKRRKLAVQLRRR